MKIVLNIFWIHLPSLEKCLKIAFVKRAVDSDFDTSKRPFQTQFMNTLNYDKIFIKIELNWADVIDYENHFE